MKSIRKLFASKKRKDNIAIKPPIKVLLLGPANSGKTTIVKQLRKIYQGLDDEDIKHVGPYIQGAVVSYMKILCIKSRQMHDEYENLLTGYIRIEISNELNIPNEIIQLCLIYYITDGYTKVKHRNEKLRHEIVNLREPFTLDAELADKICTLWHDVCI